MNRLSYFVVLLAAGLLAFVGLVVWYLAGYNSGTGSFYGVMSQMMGSQYVGGTNTAMPSYVWGGTITLLALILASGVGLAYYAVFPEIRARNAAPATVQDEPSAKGPPGADWSTLLRTSKPEEKKVLEVLASHNGRYLQKFIVKETGLSKLKTHRILSRFAERGIVVAEKSGNTNEIALASWLHPEPSA